MNEGPETSREPGKFTRDMHMQSRTASLVILGITAIVFSRSMLLLIDDPEGPNLLVVGAGAVIVFLLSLAAYAPGFAIAGTKRLFSAILIQLLLVAGFYLFLGR